MEMLRTIDCSTEAFCSAAQLASALAEDGASDSLAILDASWHLPGVNRDAGAEFRAGHIPTAQRFDIDAISDRSSPYPHMMPTPSDFAQHMNALGISNSALVIIYENGPIFAAARAWWMFKVFGHARVLILRGGLPAWNAAGHGTEGGDALAQAAPAASFHAADPSAMIESYEDMLGLSAAGVRCILDARPSGRFSGAIAEPRPIPSGHIPNSQNLPFQEVLAEDGTLKSPEQLTEIFAAFRVKPDDVLTLSCGSGVTAAVLYLALWTLGGRAMTLYDGSWSEWAAREGSPIAVSAQEQ